MISLDDLTRGLNDEQRRAVETLHGPVLILAGAGSGKTKTITHRIAHLLATGIAPHHILAVTFTNKAAGELKERIARILHVHTGSEQDQSHLPTSGTFHSLCARILRRDIASINRERSFVIYDTDDQLKAMDQVLSSLGISPQELKARPALSVISQWKNEAVSPSKARLNATSYQLSTMVDVYQKYQEFLRQANAMDFDDLLLETHRLFTECPEILNRYRSLWQYIHVDEYQDTNHVQYLLISLLASEHRNICVIGDPDQSIYSFRGADIRNILNFKNEYPDASSITLERNYRSTQIILDAADGVISMNPSRPAKKMWTDQKEGSLVHLEEVGDERREAELIAKRVLDQKKDGISFSDQVVLYRTNAQSRLLEEACLRYAIPYRILGGVKFYARKEVKDVLAYLYVILNHEDTVSLLRILNVPARKIGDTTVTRLQAFCNDRSLSLWQAFRHIDMVDGINVPAQGRIAQFVEMIDRLTMQSSNIPVSQLTCSLLDAIHFEKHLRDHTEEGEERWRNVEELLLVMKKYDHLPPLEGLTNFLEEVALISEVDKLDEETSRDSLTLMTLHLCKGLEFRSVMIAGCEEGILPHSSSLLSSEQLEEERRLLYVGMTRAKQSLALFHAMQRSQWGNTAYNKRSRFIDDIPAQVVSVAAPKVESKYGWLTSAQSSSFSPFATSHTSHGSLSFNEFAQEEPDDSEPLSLDDIQEGSVVMHRSFGQGVVLDRNGDIADILFDRAGKKRMALNIAPLTLIHRR